MLALILVKHLFQKKLQISHLDESLIIRIKGKAESLFLFNLKRSGYAREEMESVLLFVFIVAVAPRGIPMFGLYVQSVNRIGQVYDMVRNIHIVLFAMIEMV